MIGDDNSEKMYSLLKGISRNLPATDNAHSFGGPLNQSEILAGSSPEIPYLCDDSFIETLTTFPAEDIRTMWKAVEIDAWLRARSTSLEDARGTVTGIIGRVQNEGDAALRDLAKKYCELEDIAVSEEEREAAYDDVDTQVIESLIEAHARIERFHERQRPRDLWLEEMEPGIVLGMKTTALNRVGIYVPGGRAAYPSSALMCAVPAKVAGVKEICACSPPPIKPLTLVALDIAGVTEIYSAGGAQAVAAMALGTESIKPVQKIVGPGNVYVTLAKMMLREKVEIDFPAGPSEIGIIADATAIRQSLQPISSRSRNMTRMRPVS